MSKRSVFVFIGMLMVFCGLMTRYLTLAENEETAVLSGQSTATVTVATARGTIYDRNLQPFVNRAVETRFCVAPYTKTMGLLSRTLPAETFALLSERLKSGRPIVTLGDDGFPVVDGVLRFDVPVRNGTVLYAPHLVGYLSGDGVSGAVGIENAYNEFLNTHTGRITVSYPVNAAGHVLAEEKATVTDTLADSAAGVVLTVDRDIQAYVEQVAVKELKKGAIVVMNADDATVLATASVPTFQPSSVAELLNSADAPLLDRTICNYNCGSVFKIVSTAAALEAGVSPSRRYTCHGYTTVDGVIFHCHNRLGHGELDMTEAFAASCNCYFIELIQDVGPQALYYMAASLGFDRQVLLADNYKTARATIPTLEELQASRAALANLSFGQGSLLATPYHLVQLVGAVINGGELQRPSVVRGTIDANGVLTEAAKTPPQTTFSITTAETIKRMMIAAVSEGSTGETAAPLNGGAGGKTGTAESGWITENGQAVQSWFVGFYPAEAPQYIIAVLAEDSNTTGVLATSVFHRLCDGLYSFSLVN